MLRASCAEGGAQAVACAVPQRKLSSGTLGSEYRMPCTAVFLLSNLPESEEFMQAMLEAAALSSNSAVASQCSDAEDAAEDLWRGDPSRPCSASSCSGSRVAVHRSGGGTAQVDLLQLNPVAALEDVQRRSRRVQQPALSRAPQAQASLQRRSAGGGATSVGTSSSRVATARQRHQSAGAAWGAGGERHPRAGTRAQSPKGASARRFGTARGLPKVEDDVAASSTGLLYVVRPFVTPKDEQRQLGPIMVVENAYVGGAHAPHRLVVALEDQAERSGNVLTRSSSGRRRQGPLEVPQPAAAVLGPCGTQVRECLAKRGVPSLEVISVERRSASAHRWLLGHIAALLSGPHSPNNAAPIAAELQLVVGGEQGGGSNGEGGSGSATCLAAAAGTIRLAEATVAPAQVPAWASVAAGPDALEEAEEARPVWRWADAATSPSARAATSGLPSPRCSPLAAHERRLPWREAPAAPLAVAPAVPPPPSRLLRLELAPPSTREGASRSEDSERTPPERLEASGVGRQPPASVPASSPSAPAPPPPPAPALPTPLAAAAAPQGSPAATKEAPPLIQVGAARFTLPAPAVAVRRLAELWRPGAVFVVVTTQHYGTPLLCPEGDFAHGLVNLAPAGGAPEKPLVPLYWQNVDETKQALDAFVRPARGATLRSTAPRLEGVAEDEEEQEEECDE